MSLKSVCIMLARKPSSLDVVLLFASIGNILQPLCHLLDNWRYEDDQGLFCIFSIVSRDY
jgi:mediator of RNA polymerase II transcription subunit 5